MRTLRSSLLLSIIMLVSALSAQAHPFSVHDMLAMQRISSPAPSPDGSQVAFVLKTIDVEGNSSQTDLWLVRRDGSGLRRLTTNPAADFNPVWSPDGQWIYFLSTRGGTSQVWRISLQGGEAEVVTDEPLDVGNLKISPEGKTLAYTMDVFVDCEDVAGTVKRLKEIDDRPYTGRIYDHLFVRHWDTWEDGRRTHLFARKVDGGTSVDVCKGLDGNTPSRPFGGSEEFTFTPDGRALVFSMKVAGREEAWSTNYDLYVAPIDGSVPAKNITAENPAWDTQPVFSSDGKTLAYLAMKRPGYESDRYRIVLREWNGEELSVGPPRWLTEDFDRSFYGLFWGPKSRFIYCYGPHLGQRALWKVAVKDGKHTLLHSMGTVRSPAFAADRIVFGLDHLRSPVELYSIKPNGKDLLRITHINDERVAEAEMGQPEQFTFEGAGGDEVYAYVVTPANFDASKRYPVAFVMITLPAEEVDVNVHPAKTEVRFRNGDEVFRAVQRAVRSTVMDEAPAAASWQAPAPAPAHPTLRQQLAALRPAPQQATLPDLPSARPSPATRPETQPEPLPATVHPPEPFTTAPRRLPPLRVVGQVSTMFIIAEGPDGLYLIDQHAAHERILYEQMIAAWRSGDIPTQALLEPAVVTLPADDAARLEPLLPALHTLGVTVEPFGGSSFLVRGLPAHWRDVDPQTLLADLAANAESNAPSPVQIELEEMLVRRICKKLAVKGGQILSREEMERLVQDLERTENPRTCPHGRPTIIQISLEQLAHQFGR